MAQTSPKHRPIPVGNCGRLSVIGDLAATKWPGSCKIFPQASLNYPLTNLFLLSETLKTFEDEWIFSRHIYFPYFKSHRDTQESICSPFSCIKWSFWAALQFRVGFQPRNSRASQVSAASTKNAFSCTQICSQIFALKELKSCFLFIIILFTQVHLQS